VPAEVMVAGVVAAVAVATGVAAEEEKVAAGVLKVGVLTTEVLM
jgi:hypothetical protein